MSLLVELTEGRHRMTKRDVGVVGKWNFFVNVKGGDMHAEANKVIRPPARLML